ncbi:MAG: pyridoxine 5'-phosphate synthase [Gemmatimonadota bacterium]|nr:MAG: pyridoxine 5'-phosphate synthase [Gemmatimonadota bacterium]
MRLYINVDHVATVRQARRTDEPDPLQAAALCEKAGADGITMHLREDRRHIQDDDVLGMAQSVTTALNLELAAVPDIVTMATEIKPHHTTIVPERREEITTEGGLDLGVGGKPEPRLLDAIATLSDAGILISLFIDPDLPTIERAAELGVPAVELHTGDYANSYLESDAALERLRQAATHAEAAGLAVHAGHGLTYRNVQPVAAIPEVEELNIGHSIISHSITVGIEAAVREMRSLVDSAC